MNPFEHPNLHEDWRVPPALHVVVTPLAKLVGAGHTWGAAGAVVVVVVVVVVVTSLHETEWP